MEAHDQILHGLLDMGQMLLLCGAEINRVEDHAKSDRALPSRTSFIR